MPYNTDIEDRISAFTGRWRNMTKKNMFGGVCYLYRGNMCFGIYKDYLIVRAGEQTATDKMKLKTVHPFDITGKPMKGWCMVEKKGWQRENDMKNWLEIGRDFAKTLPPKPGK